MQTRVDEIAPDTFRISTFHPEFGIQFNQFLVRDEEPFLMHTGMRRMFAATRDAVRQLIDPARLAWIGFSHFEPDECGALNEWLAVAPHAQAVSGPVGSLVMLSDFADRPPRMLEPGDLEVVRVERLVDDDRVVAISPRAHECGRDVARSRPHGEPHHCGGLRNRNTNWSVLPRIFSSNTSST